MHPTVKELKITFDECHSFMIAKSRFDIIYTISSKIQDRNLWNFYIGKCYCYVMHMAFNNFHKISYTPFKFCRWFLRHPRRSLNVSRALLFGVISNPRSIGKKMLWRGFLSHKGSFPKKAFFMDLKNDGLSLAASTTFFPSWDFIS